MDILQMKIIFIAILYVKLYLWLFINENYLYGYFTNENYL